MAETEIIRSDRALIQAALETCKGDAEKAPELEGALVTRWFVITEHMAVDGERWLSMLGSDGITAWDKRGMLHEALYGDWPDPDDA